MTGRLRIARPAAAAAVAAFLAFIASAPQAAATGAAVARDVASPDAAAPRARCAGAGDPSASPATQEHWMLCLVNRVRRRHGLAPLAVVTSLRRAAGRKSADILRCDEFSHEACGREFTYWMSRFGYNGCREAENIAWESGPYTTPGEVFGLWMHSPGHRANILGPYRDTGIGLRIGTLEGYGGAHVWTEEFGARSC